MDRRIVYPAQVPFETDILNTNRFVLTALGLLAQDILGSGTVVSGLACTPTSPASLNVQIGAGRLYSLQNLDNTAYSSLAADTAHQIVKQGMLLDPISLGCAAPSTFGFSINYLIQATYQDSDTDLLPLPYYNVNNPSQALSGPNNSGSAQATNRRGVITINAKPGTAATTGTQTTPAPDAGFVGLYVVTVANGQTTITSGNIADATSAPIMSQSLLASIQGQRIRLQANTTFYVATTGSDSNSGLSASTPWATVQHAINVLQQNYDLNGFTATILRANGTYNESVSINGPLVGQFGPGDLVITGSNSANVTVNAVGASACYEVDAGAMVTISNQKLASASGNLMNASFASVLQHSGCNFGAAPSGVHCAASFGATVQAIGNYTISGGATAHLEGSGCGSVAISSVTITITGTPSFSNAFAFATQVGFINSSATTFTGSVTGVRYAASLNGAIETAGGGANYFPGSVAGATSTGGQYH